MKSSEYTAIVVGSGVAGLYAALKLSELKNAKQNILVITKSGIKDSNSRYAQGGIVSVMSENPTDSVKLHVQDTLKSGAGLSDPSVVEFISKNSEKVIKDLLKHGVKFDRNDNGELCFTKEGAHSVRRILHAGGDATGLFIEQALADDVLAKNNINVLEGTIVTELLLDKNGVCCGVIAFDDEEGEYQTFYSNAVILATGGCGQLYKYTTNPSVTTGDGMAVAYRAGAVMQDMEFFQFHPTAFKAKTEENMFLISEAVRGEGAKLTDENGNTFMEKYDERLELASRDIVSRAIFNEMRINNVPNVYLNATVIPKDKLNQRFPTILGTCRKNGVDPENQFIPVSPAAHYMMGGVKASVTGVTSIKNLYVIGETACTGLHGANRLASNSLLECAVTGYEIAELLKDENFDEVISDENDEKIAETIAVYEKPLDEKSVDFKVLREKLRDTMWQYVGIIRNEQNLEHAKKEVEKIEEAFGYADKCPNKEAFELRNMIVIAKLVIDFAIRRKESRGGHFREDYTGKHEPARHYTRTKNTDKYEEIYVK